MYQPMMVRIIPIAFTDRRPRKLRGGISAKELIVLFACIMPRLADCRWGRRWSGAEIGIFRWPVFMPAGYWCCPTHHFQISRHRHMCQTQLPVYARVLGVVDNLATFKRAIANLYAEAKDLVPPHHCRLLPKNA